MMRRYIIGFDLNLEDEPSALWLVEWCSTGLELRSLVCMPPRTDFFLQLRVLDDMVTGLGTDVAVILVTDQSGYSAYAADDVRYRHPEIRIDPVSVERLRAMYWPPRKTSPRVPTCAERWEKMRHALEVGIFRMADHFEYSVIYGQGAPKDLN